MLVFLLLFLPSLGFLAFWCRLASIFVASFARLLDTCLSFSSCLILASLLIFVFIATTAPLLAIFVVCLLLSGHDAGKFFILQHLLPLTFLLGGWSRDDLEDLFASIWAISARPELTIAQKYAAVLVTAKELLN